MKTPRHRSMPFFGHFSKESTTRVDSNLVFVGGSEPKTKTEMPMQRAPSAIGRVEETIFSEARLI